MRLFIHNIQIGRPINIYSIEVPDYIRISTLAQIIKDKENINEPDFNRLILSACQPLYGSCVGPPEHLRPPDMPISPPIYYAPNDTRPDNKLSDIPNLNNNPHINKFLFTRLRADPDPPDWIGQGNQS